MDNTLSQTMEVTIVLGLMAVAALSHFPVNLICGYIKSKPIGLQCLVDLIYSDVARLLKLLLLLLKLLLLFLNLLLLLLKLFLLLLKLLLL